jgi:pimeloyl-ACP methyl ester carboxylesterase
MSGRSVRPLCYPLAVASGVTRVLEQGRGEAAVVFLHGVGARADRWWESLAACADAGYHAYAVDFPGHGFAVKGGDREYSVPALTRFVGEILDELALSEVVLVGTSLGGHVAASVSLGRPAQVTGLVLAGPMGLVPVGDRVRGRLADAVVDTTREGIRGKLLALVENGALVTDEWVLEEFNINNSPGADAGFELLADYFRSSIDDDVLDAAVAEDRPDLPCLLVWGGEDQMVPVSMAAAVLANLPSSCRYEVIPGTGHAPYLEDPGTFNAALLNFLGQQPLVKERRTSDETNS